MIKLRSRAMRAVYERVDRIAEAWSEGRLTEAVVFLRGPSGSGKTALVDYLVERSQARTKKKRRPVCANLGAIPDDLLEGELFGAVRGAYTGADRTRKGLIERAGGGVLFLDEIGAISPRAQAALLRLLGERKYTPLGASTEVEVNCRIIVATWEPLEQYAEEGRFRGDLVARIQPLSIELTPLRERPEDAIDLGEAFAAAHGIEADPEAFRALAEVPWGDHNAREVERVVLDAFASDGWLSVDHVRDVARARSGATASTSSDPISEAILRDIAERGYTSAGAVSRLLGISPRTARRHLSRGIRDGCLSRTGGGRATIYTLK